MKYLTFLICAILFFSSCGNCDLMGALELGNNLVLLEGDREEDRIIVACTGRSGGCCKAGTYVIPAKYEDHISDGRYKKYVEMANANKNWIIARSFQIDTQEREYWIIDKSFDQDSIHGNYADYVIGPLDSLSFKDNLRQLDVRLDFK